MSGIAKSLLNQRFDRLLVISRDAKSPLVNRGARWLCRCDCGGTATVRSDALKSGHIRSCGCLNNEQRRINLDTTTHGYAKAGAQTRTYSAWLNMRRRCYESTNSKYHRYGGRGIGVCARWRTSFENFLSDMGECPSGLTLDRSNNDGDYKPGNCKWVTMKEQCNNRMLRCDARLLTCHGETKPIAAWVRDPRVAALGLGAATLNSRIQHGMSDEQVLTRRKQVHYKK